MDDFCERGLCLHPGPGQTPGNKERGLPIQALHLLLPILLLLSSACTGSPQKEKMTVDLSARSTFTLRMEKTSDEDSRSPAAHITNSRFLFAPYARTQSGSTDHFVLRETVRFQESPTHEQTNGEILVEAFPATGASESSLVWKFQSQGVGGGIYDVNLYRVMQTACCGASERTLHHSLIDGRELFSSTVPVALIEHAGTRQKRYIGFDDGYGSVQPKEITTENTILGILYYSSESSLLHKAIVHGNRSRECRAVSASISIGSKRSDTTMVTLFRYEATPTFDGIDVIVDLECLSDGIAERCRVPIAGDSPSLSQSTTTPGISVKAMN